MACASCSRFSVDGCFSLTLDRFLLARLHVDTLVDQTTRKRLRATLAKMKKGSEGLDLAYKDALDRIDGQSNNHRKLAKQALCWISFAQRPITTNELCHALAIEPGEGALDQDNMTDTRVIVSVCAGLVTVDKESSIIRLVHYTTQEYFQRVRLEWNPGTQEEIAASCLTYLSFETFKSGSCPSDKTFEHRLAENQFFDYSARHWSEHVRPVERCTSTCNLALDFLSNVAFVNATIQAASMRGHKYSGYSGRFPSRTTGLHLTARYGLLHLTERLLPGEHEESNTVVDSKDNYGRTPLLWAAERGHEGVVKLLRQRI